MKNHNHIIALIAMLATSLSLLGSEELEKQFTSTENLHRCAVGNQESFQRLHSHETRALIKNLRLNVSKWMLNTYQFGDVDTITNSKSFRNFHARKTEVIAECIELLKRAKDLALAEGEFTNEYKQNLKSRFFYLRNKQRILRHTHEIIFPKESRNLATQTP